MEPTVDAREERGRQIATAAQIKRVGRRWAVPSQTRASERYLVDVEESACTCPDFEERRGTCKHLHAVLFWIAWGRDVGEDDGRVTSRSRGSCTFIRGGCTFFRRGKLQRCKA